MQMRRNNRGFLAVVFILLLIVGGIGIYYGYQWHSQRNYIVLYDGSMTRNIDTPPFAERLSSSDRELIGECVLAIGTSLEQTSDFYKSMSDRYGYLFNVTEGGLTMEVRKNYKVTGTFAEGKLTLTWTPVLNEKLKKKAQSLFADEIAKKEAAAAKGDN